MGFDPRTTAFIHLRLGEGLPTVRCHRIDPESKYKDCDWREVETYIEKKKLADALAAPERLQAESDFDAGIQAIVDKAEAKKALKAPDQPQSKRSRTQNINAHMKTEIQDMHQAEIQELYGALDEGGSARYHTSRADELTDAEDYVPFPQPTNVRDIRERMMKNDRQ